MTSEKLNIAELLKSAPEGTELYSPICGECRLIKIYDSLGIDVINGTDDVFNFSYDGRYNLMGECCIFPSKEQRDWSKFQRPFKDGDILFIKSAYSWILIYKDSENKEDIYKYAATSVDSGNKFIVYDNNPLCYKGDVSTTRFATDEEKEKLFKAIKDNGYKWNAETKTLEKLIKPKFKVGDRVKDKNNKIWFVVQVSDKHFSISSVPNAEGYFVPIGDQDDYELIPNKFDINTLKPFDKVLVAHKKGEWHIQFFEKYSPTSKFPFICIGGSAYQKCIPYKGNEYLRGTTNDCDEYFKNWE